MKGVGEVAFLALLIWPIIKGFQTKTNPIMVAIATFFHTVFVLSFIVIPFGLAFLFSYYTNYSTWGLVVGILVGGTIVYQMIELDERYRLFDKFFKDEEEDS